MNTENRMETGKTTQGQPALKFGVDVLLDEVYTQPELPEAVKQALVGTVTWHQRSETSVGRFLAGPNQFPALTLALLVSDARVMTSGDDGEMDLNSFLLSRARPVAVALWVPLESAIRKIATARVGWTSTGQDIVLAAAAVITEGGVVQSARLALSGVWPKKQWLSTAADKLVGASLNDAAIQSVAAAVQAEVDPPSDHHGSAAYRRAMASVVSQRALEGCR